MIASIVAYRNPLEKWLWESGTVTIMLVVVGSVLILGFVYSQISDYLWRKKHHKNR